MGLAMGAPILSGNLTWPLFVHIANSCFDPAAPRVERDLGRCVSACGNSDDASREECHDDVRQTHCSRLLRACIAEAAETHDASAAPEPLYGLANFTRAAASAECCDPGYVRRSVPRGAFVEGTWSPPIEEASAVLSHCGFVVLPGFVAAPVAEAAGAAVNATIADREHFLRHYVRALAIGMLALVGGGAALYYRRQARRRDTWDVLVE